MNNPVETPRIFHDTESFVISANRAGLKELREKADYLLNQKLTEVSLDTPDTDFDFSTLCLACPETSETETSFKTTLVIVSIILLTCTFLLVGAAATIKWLYYLIFQA